MSLDECSRACSSCDGAPDCKCGCHLRNRRKKVEPVAPSPTADQAEAIDVRAYNERTWRDIQSRTIVQKHRPESMDGFTYGAAIVALEEAIDEALTIGLAAGVRAQRERDERIATRLTNEARSAGKAGAALGKRIAAAIAKETP